MIRRRVRSVIFMACATLLSVQRADAQFSYYDDPWVVPAQAFDPAPVWPDPGVTLQGIQPFDPYATTAPALPPPLSGSAPTYPAPLPPYGPAYSGGPAVGSPPGFPSGPSAALGGPYQPSFNFLGGGLYGGFQGAILEPRFGNYTIDSNKLGSPVAVTTAPDHGFQFSPRIIVGFEGPEGLGVRGRWWHFKDDQAGTSDVTLPVLIPSAFLGTPTTTEIKLDAIDLELTQDGRFHNWEFLVSGGVRYTQLDSLTEAKWTNVTPRFFRAETDFTGVGPTLGLSARRAMRQWEGLTFVMNSRFSFLFGDVNVTHTGNLTGAMAGPVQVTEVDDVMPAWELQIGAQWARRLNSGATFYFGAFFEGQLWDWVSPSLINSDLGFWGPTVTVGISR